MNQPSAQIREFQNTRYRGLKKLFKDSLTQRVRMSQDVPLDDADEQEVVLGEK